jgi:replication-associated recombination protein RarA
MLPSLYIPKSPSDFIGPAARCAKLLERAVADAIAADRAPLKILLNGEPGIGKSALARYLMGLLGCDKWSCKKYSGTDVDVEQVRDISADLHYKDLFGGWRLIWIEEADLVPATAQNRFLLLLDDLPPGSAVVCTSNCKQADFKRRFETRFKLYELDPPSAEEIQTLLRRFIPPAQAIQIATFACGNVRAALLDAEQALQAAA